MFCLLFSVLLLPKDPLYISLGIGPIFLGIRDQFFIFCYLKTTSMYTLAHFIAELISMN